MQGWLLRWLLNIIAILITSYLIPGFELSFIGAVLGSIILGIVNAVIRPILIILTLPLNIMTLGLFTLVINGFMLWLTAYTVPGFHISGFGSAILCALVLSIVSFILSFLIKDKNH
ncbi:MAG: phage holin family protein [Syntrophomonadaceae bacterium]|nr:phage holin family protein [Syntrophomonadaceae bacterium]